MNSSSVLKLTDRAELYKILSFLNEFIPYCCEVHSIVLAALQTQNPCYNIYYLLNTNYNVTSSDSSDKEYSAIVGVKKEHALDPKTNSRSVAWMLAPWFKDVDSLVKVYRSIDEGIDWNRDSFFLFNHGHEPPAEVLQYLKNDCKVKEERLTTCTVNRYNTTFAEALDLEIKVPEEVYIKSLERKDAGIIYDTWAFKHSSSIEDLEDEIEQLPSAGVFLKETDELICWINCHLAFGMSRLFTLEAHRRKGYATLAIQCAAKKIAQAGYVPFITAMTYLPLNNQFFGNLPGFKFLKAAHGLYISPSLE